MVTKKQKKVIWYCHHYAGAPSVGMSYRPYYLSREFEKKAHEVYVIGASEHHLLIQSRKQKKAISKQEIDGVTFILLKTPAYNYGKVRRLFNIITYVLRFYFNQKQIIALTGKPDVIIVSSAHPFHYPFLKRLAKQQQCKIIFEVRDLWPLSLVDLMKISRWNPLVLWLSYIEKYAYQSANAVVSLLDNAFPYMKAKGLKEERYFHIPNGACVELFENPQPLPLQIAATIESLKTTQHFLVAYAGAIGKPNALQYLIAAMQKIAVDYPLIHCLIVGNGQLKTTLEDEIKKKRILNITFLPSISKYQIPTFLKAMDILYLGREDADVFQYGVSPNKLYDYMLAGKPIIDSGGKSFSLVEKYACGIRCTPANHDLIASAIITLYQMSPTERLTMGIQGSKAVRNEYDYHILARKYQALF